MPYRTCFIPIFTRIAVWSIIKAYYKCSAHNEGGDLNLQLENQLHGVSLSPQLKILNKEYLKTKGTRTAGEVLWYVLDNVLDATGAEYEWEINQYLSVKAGEEIDKFSHHDLQILESTHKLGKSTDGLLILKKWILLDIYISKGA